MHKKTIKRCLLVAALVAVLAGVSVIMVKQQKKKETEHRLESRFDKFMGFYYPYLKDISDAAAIYKLMETSLMYDYLSYHKGRFIDENVNYYYGGFFSMRDYNNIRKFLEEMRMLYACRAYGPIDTAPPSRIKEKESCYRILNTMGKLLSVDIYDSEIGMNGLAERKREILDSLNLEIQSSYLELIKYKVSGPRIDLNTISEVDYNLNSY